VGGDDGQLAAVSDLMRSIEGEPGFSP
jgi:hypothetical protein